MAKILVIGDCHLGMSYPNNYQKWFDISREYFETFLIPFVEKEMCKDDMIVQLGDLFDNRSLIPIDILNYAQNIIERLSLICPIHILVGNHDMFHKSTGDLNSLNVFRFMPNVFIYKRSTKIEFDGKKILMMPYIENKKEQIQVLQYHSGCDYLFCHSDLNGAKMHLNSIAHKNKDKISEDEFKGYKIVKTGHIHIQQKIKNIHFVGSIFEMDRNDMDNKKGILLMDVDTQSEKFIENMISPKFKKVYIQKAQDVDSLDSISTRDYIDLNISNSLLMSNRKLRRKIEILLETGNFSSVEYIDDISFESKDDTKTQKTLSHKEDDIENISSITMDYENIIRDYIRDQVYSSDKVKNGIEREFDKIISLSKN